MSKIFFRKNKKWKMPAKCDNCPFSDSEAGLHLRRSLGVERWEEITNALLHYEHFLCHKTTEECGDGSKLVCGGSIEWQAAHGIVANYIQIRERLELMMKKRGGIMSDYLTVGDAAKIIKVSADSIRLYEKHGKLPAVRTASGIRLFNRHDVEMFAKKRRLNLGTRNFRVRLKKRMDSQF